MWAGAVPLEDRHAFSDDLPRGVQTVRFDLLQSPFTAAHAGPAGAKGMPDAGGMQSVEPESWT